MPEENIMDEADRKIANLVRLAQTLADAKRWRDQRTLADEQERLRSAQYRLNAATSTARPYLAEGMRDRWWNEAQLEDAAHMLGVAERFAADDPMAEQVRLRAKREIRTRWGVDVDAPPDWRAVLDADDKDVRRLEPRLPDEPATEPDEARAEVVEHRASIDREATITALEANANLPAHVRDGLLARLRGNGVEEVDADRDLNRAQAERDRAVGEENEAEVRALSGDPAAEGELGRARAARAAAEDTLDTARSRAARARTGDREADAGIEAREVSFPVPAGQAVKGKTKKTKTRVGRAKTRQTEKKAGKGR